MIKKRSNNPYVVFCCFLQKLYKKLVWANTAYRQLGHHIYISKADRGE
jgi:hypothetical protein